VSTRQAYPALPPQRDAVCEGCRIPYLRPELLVSQTRVTVRARLKLVNVDGNLARLCDKCRREYLHA
jgi:hypothetical protein